VPTDTNINYCSISASANPLGLLPVVVSLDFCSTYFTSLTTISAGAGVGPCGVSATANAFGVPVIVTLSNSLCSTQPQTGTITVLAASASIGACSISASANALGIPVVVTVPNLCSTSQFAANIGSCGIVASAGVLGIPIAVSLGNGLCSYSYSQTGLGLPTITTTLGGTLTGSLGLNLGSSNTSPLSIPPPTVPVVTVPLGGTVGSCGISASVGVLGIPVVVNVGGSCSTYYTTASSTISASLTSTPGGSSLSSSSSTGMITSAPTRSSSSSSSSSAAGGGGGPVGSLLNTLLGGLRLEGGI
jgi:hypothetical protein